MNQSPILSLCIPTYNRANILEKTISIIVSCRSFDSDVELVISDNCSTDNTRQVCGICITVEKRKAEKGDKALGKLQRAGWHWKG